MHPANLHRKGALLLATVGAVLGFCAPGEVVHSEELALASAVTAGRIEAPTPADNPRTWLERIFAKPAATPREQSIAQLEAMGLTLDADSCNRAVAAKNRRLIDLFLASGFDLNAKGAQGRTPLLTAAVGQNWPLVAELLKAGANPNVPDDQGATALMAAATAQQTAPIEDLIKAGANVAAKDVRGHTALHFAVATLHPANIAALIKHQCPVAGPCCEGSDLLAHAFATNRKDIIVPVLEAQARDLVWTTEARVFLTASIDARDQAMTRLTLSKFATPPTPEGKAQPLLAYAMLDGDMEKFKYLLDCGADPNSLLNSPVEKAFSARVPSAYTRLYLDNEAGMSTLMLAAGLAKTDYVKTLLDHGGKRFLATAKYKMPALFFAAQTEVPEIMQMLIGDSSPSPDQWRIEITLSAQRLNLYKDNQSIFTAPVSTGKPGHATPAGRYIITDKHLVHVSTIYKTASMPFFMRLNCRDFGMHEGNLPGYPASHGCIRLPGSAARYLYKDVPIGTLVSIQ